MKTTMSTAAVSIGLVQQGSSAVSSGGGDSGFSRILSGVQGAQGGGANSASRGTNGTNGADRMARSDSVRKENASFSDHAEKAFAAASETAAGEMTVSEAETGTALGEAAGTIAAAGENPGQAENPVSGEAIKTFSDMEYRAVGSASFSLEERLNEMIMILSNGDEDEEGKVIDALLEILRKMQQEKPDKDGDEAVDLVMQMLMAMLGGQETDNAALQLSVQNISEEMSVICGVYRGESADPAFGQDAGVDGNAASSAGSTSAETAQDDPSAQGALQAQESAQTAEQPVAERTEETFAAEKPKFRIEPEELAQAKTTEAELPADEAQTEKPEAAQPDETAAARQNAAETVRQNETAQQTQTLPQTAERLLSEILDKAREELGLTKAELIRTPEKTEERTLSILPKTETEAESPDGREAENGARNPEPRIVNPTAKELAMSPNHKDGRGELDRILGGEGEPNERKNDLAKQSPNAAIPQRAEIREIETPREDEARTSAIPPERQLTDEILARSETFEGGRSEFTMVLNPESLGRITVRLISAGGRVQVSIAAENDATRQLLAAREDQIGSAMKTNGVELERYQVVSGREEAQLMQDNYDGSSKNPYGQQEERSEERTDDEDDFLEILQQL